MIENVMKNNISHFISYNFTFQDEIVLCFTFKQLNK